MAKKPDAPEEVGSLWRDTLGAESFETLDVLATCKPANPYSLLASLGSEEAAAEGRDSLFASTVEPVGANIVFASDAALPHSAPLDHPTATFQREDTAAPFDEGAATLAQDDPQELDDAPEIPPHEDHPHPPAEAAQAPSEAIGASLNPLADHCCEHPWHRVSQFQVVTELGRGGMGVVYRVEQGSMARQVALKMVLPGLSDQYRSKFHAEALVTGTLEHPNIIPVHELFHTDSGADAFVMKLVSGRTWAELLKDDSYDQLAHLQVLLSVCNALEYAHSKHLVHLDLKPENIMVGEFGEILVMDWGLALDIHDSPQPDSIVPHRSSLEVPCGTPCYMAPELALGEGNSIGTTTDVYLLGAMLHEILVGHPPHWGNTVLEVLTNAVVSELPPYSPEVPRALQELCRHAMARDPIDRMQTVRQFRETLEAYIEHRESMLLTANAKEQLQACLNLDKSPSSEGGLQKRRYSELSTALAGFRQARFLWSGNREAVEGQVQTHLAFAREALKRGDFGLAEDHVDALGEDHPEQRGLRETLQEARKRRRRKDRQGWWLRRGLMAAISFIIVGLTVAYFAIDQERERTQQSATLAEGRLADIQRLSDVQRVKTLYEKEQALWPALPKMAPGLSRWLEEARELLSHLPEHRTHLERLRGTLGRKKEDGWFFAAIPDQWEHDTLTSMVDALARMESELLPKVEKRLDMARTIEEHTLRGPRPQWDRAIASIADPKESPQYAGLKLAPQLGLIPLGKDPQSGLWEFLHYQSGIAPQRQKDGGWLPSEETGVILVLLPAGSFSMGAKAPTFDDPLGGANVDSQARSSEGPVHSVSLSAFFIGKHELTQGQWQRFTGGNPAAYLPGTKLGGHEINLRHPVEQVRWKEAYEALHHMDLQLPTEAQWEYATRAGTTTVYWSGDKKESLQGTVNIADHYCMTHEGPGSWRYEAWLDDGHTVHAPVGSYRANAFGLHDTAGNVWEWVEDRYGSFDLPVRAGDGLRASPETAPRVFRGGGFRAARVHARSADRYSLYAHEFRAYDVGVRAARRVDPAPSTD